MYAVDCRVNTQLLETCSNSYARPTSVNNLPVSNTAVSNRSLIASCCSRPHLTMNEVIVWLHIHNVTNQHGLSKRSHAWYNLIRRNENTNAHSCVYIITIIVLIIIHCFESHALLHSTWDSHCWPRYSFWQYRNACKTHKPTVTVLFMFRADVWHFVRIRA